MIPDQWQKAKELYEAALKRPPADRLRFVNDNSQGDDVVRQEVESLLANSDDAAGFLEHAAIGEVAEAIVGQREELRANEELSHYKIIKLLGTGGMGEVYLADDTRLHRHVALKVLPDYSSGNRQHLLERFLREARAASALNHPNICTIYEIHDDGDTPFIAMEYIVGETLDEKIHKGLKPNEFFDIALKVADALAEAHAQGFVHRDIKPANIVITARGPKVLDFGLAKKIVADRNDETQKIVTQAGMIIGTAGYMSPEQARGKSVDARSDIFSFGVVMYEMIAGKPPFDGENAMDVISSILHKTPTPLHQLMPEVSPDVERIINKALKKDREERFQTVKDLLIDLKEVKQALEFQNKLERTAPPNREYPNTQNAIATTGDAVHTTSSAEYVASEIKKHKFAFLALLVFLLLAFGGLGFWYFYDRSADTRQIISIAVLPFQNDNESNETEYLSDGMTESLITRLAQLPKLNVKARSSVFRYKGKEDELQRIGKELGVEAILTGRIVQRGNDLTLYITLVDAVTEKVLWKSDYNRSMTNLVALQSDVARDVSNKLQLKLSGADEQKLKKSYTTNAEAYQLYMKGRFHLLRGQRPETETATVISYFQQAIEADPNYALAYAGLADAYRGRAVGSEMPSAEVMPKSKAAANKAIEIDDTLAEAHANLGHVMFWYDWDWNAAEKEYKRALELDPNSPDALEFYAHVLSTTGRHAEALEKIKLARELDPVNLRVNAIEGMLLLYAGQTDEAIARLQKTLELDPNFRMANMMAARAYIEKGMFAEAIAATRKSRELFPGSSQSIAYGAYALAKSGKITEARASLDEMLAISKTRWVPPYNFALIYNALGESGKALDYLERGFAEKDVRMVFLKVEPKWNNLRSEPRFIELIKRMRLE